MILDNVQMAFDQAYTAAAAETVRTVGPYHPSLRLSDFQQIFRQADAGKKGGVKKVPGGVGPGTWADLKCRGLVKSARDLSDENWQTCESMCQDQWGDGYCAAGCFGKWDNDQGACVLAADCIACNEIPDISDFEPEEPDDPHRPIW